MSCESNNCEDEEATVFPWYWTHPSPSVEVNKTRAIKPPEPPAEIDEEMYNKKWTERELIQFCLRRLMGRWHKDEIAWFESQLGHPVTFQDQHLKDNQVITARLIKTYLKDYKKGKVGPVLNVHEYKEILQDCNKIINSSAAHSEPKEKVIIKKSCKIATK